MDIQDLLNESPSKDETTLDSETESRLHRLTADDVDHDQLKDTLEQLAASSRGSEALRHRLASPTNLARLTQIITSESGKPTGSLQPALRCIGNACFEKEDAANTVASLGLDWAVTILHGGDQAIIAITTSVLNNICIQSVEAQKQACKLGLDDDLLYLLTRPDEDDGFASVPLEVVLLIASHRKEVNREGMPSWKAHGTDFTTDVLAWANRTDASLGVENWACMLEITLTYLREPDMQGQVVESKQVDMVWDLLSRNEDLISQQGEAASSGAELDSAEVRRLLKPESMSLTWVLSDLAAHSAFVSNYELENSWLQGVIIDSLRHAPSAVGGATAVMNSHARPNAACQVLGNLLHALPPSSAMPLVQEKALHQPLLAAMASTDDADFLHSATGLLIKLARPSSDICETIASDANLFPALEKLNAHPMQQLKQDALALMRVLGKDSPAVQERLRDIAKDVLVAAAAAQNQEAANGGAPQALTPGSITGVVE